LLKDELGLLAQYIGLAKSFQRLNKLPEVPLRILRSPWNSLPAKCRNCLGLTVQTFKKYLKTYLFETAFITTALMIGCTYE